jgi:outer membrane lipoprotein-sorting protein
MKILFFILPLLLPVLLGAKPPPAEELLRRADRARGGLAEGLTWDVKIKDTQGGHTKESAFEVKVKGTNVLAVCTAPARQKGETYLFNDRNLWVYRPNLRKPISVSTRQRLSGQTANGDIANTNYAKDYHAEFLAEEVVDGEKVHKLLLKAKSSELTYDRIHYWVSPARGLGLKAEFLTAEGKPFKLATFKYDHRVKVGAKDEPFVSEMTITEAAFPENRSVLSYENLKATALKDSIFNVNNLAR